MNKLTAYIGKNGSGKTYTLNKILEDNPENTLYISEEGIPKILYQKNQVSIDIESGKYIYSDELERGKTRNIEEVIINDNSRSIIEYCQGIILKNENIKNKSQGQKKLDNMMNIFLSYNLNNIKNILFDEPENFFDEEYLKLIGSFIKILNQNLYNIFLATHNSRLLSILEIDIDNIVLMNISENNKYEKKSISKKDMKEIFSKISYDVKSLIRKYKYNENSIIKYKLSIHKTNKVFDHYLDYYINSLEFYSSLFYTTIIIVEGISDFEAIKNIGHKLKSNVYVFSAHGKAWIPFYVNLFSRLGKTVIAIIDTDSNNKSHASILTSILENMENKYVRLVQHEPDMEGEYNIDIKNIGKDLNIPKKVRNNERGWVKQLAASYFFKEQKNWRKLERNIFPKGRSYLEDKNLINRHIMKKSLEEPNYYLFVITLGSSIEKNYTLDIMNDEDSQINEYRVRNFIIDDSFINEEELHNIYLKLESLNTKKIEEIILNNIDIQNIERYESSDRPRFYKYYLKTEDKKYRFTFTF